MNLPNEIIIEIFEKIPISNYKQYIKLSRVNKQFNNIYKIHFQEKVKNYKYINQNRFYIYCCIFYLRALGPDDMYLK